MDSERLLSQLAGHRRRLRAASVAVAVVTAAAAAGVGLGVLMLSGAPASTSRIVAIVAFVTVLGWAALNGWRRWTWAGVAQAIEARVPQDNLVVTAEEVAHGRTDVRNAAIKNEVFASAVLRLERLPPAAIQPLSRPLGLAALAVIAVAGAIVAVPQAVQRVTADPGGERSSAPGALTRGDVRVVITPPAYAGREAVEAVNPTNVTVLEGSDVRLEVRTAAAVTLHQLDGRETAFAARDGVAVHTLTATDSRPLLIRQRGGDAVIADRLIHLRVEPDQRAVVTIREPAKDLIFAEGRGEVPVEIDARDDVALESLTLRYTHVSGSGETFTFEEGEWPVTLAREDAATWRGRAVFSLDQLNLQDGDSIVYRAVARDAKPGRDPSMSESYLIEVGRLGGVASQGFAVDEERDRHAISQQMVIMKTEKLHAARGTMPEASFLEQAQLLAVEQRMVQAEFVFMTGGHVHDEIEEAEQSHEIAEGRLENSATAEMMNAIREMSRAEARLNAGDTATALPFERAALAALQRAFDRRRYFLRTLPERSRIDVTRRLTGELDTARSSSVAREAAAPDPLMEGARAVLNDLQTADVGTSNLALLASRMLALDAGSEELQRAALRLGTVDRNDAAAAVEEAQRAVIGVMRARMARQLALPLARDPVRGRLLEELREGTPR